LIEQQHANDSHFGDRMHDSMVRLSAQKQYKRTMAFVLYTVDLKNVKSPIKHSFSSSLTANFDSFHLPSCDVEELLRDGRPFSTERPFSPVLYAALRSYECGDDPTMGKKILEEILNMTLERGYSDVQTPYP
jgi:hypothetical protein